MAKFLYSASLILPQSQTLEGRAGPTDRQPDPEPVRLLTRLHLRAGRPRTANWRVVAELMDGRRRLVCLGTTPRDARAAARRAASAGDLPPHTIGLRMQRWTEGGWREEEG